MQIQIQRLQAAVADMREKLIWVWATKVSQVTRLAHAADHSLNDWRQTMTLELTLTLYPSRLV